jgi:hypothetical protein
MQSRGSEATAAESAAERHRRVSDLVLLHCEKVLTMLEVRGSPGPGACMAYLPGHLRK